jgi:protein-S-isoprenylcysteine O-methyltransferase Ste14
MSWDLRIAVFVTATLPLLYVSRASLVRPRSHGFFRFFAWEAIVGLSILNAPVWFRSWLSRNQIISWIMLLVSLIPLALGVGGLRRRGQPDPKARADTGLLAFERTTQLVSAGIFGYIRHPMYCSLLLLTWGLFFKDLSTGSAALASAGTLSLLLTAKADEAECLRAFGNDYRNYMQRTRMFIPHLL